MMIYDVHDKWIDAVGGSLVQNLPTLQCMVVPPRMKA